MRIAVLGAGAMGGTMAALLDRAGHEVEVTARGQNLAAIQRDGLRLTGAWGEHTARVAAGEQLTVRPELAILATKAMDAAPAGAANARLLRGVPLIVVQNGLGGLETVERALPESTTIGALSLIAASYVAFGHVDVTTAAATWLGIPGSGDDTAAQIAASVLSEAFPCSAVANFDGARWTKLVINQVNALPAITGLSVQDVIAHPGLRRIMTRSMRETVRAGLHAGVRFEPLNGVTPQLLWLVGRAPLSVGQLLPLTLRSYLGSIPNPGSTLQSIRRGQASEIDYLNGAVAATAGPGRAPVNETLVRLVHQVERTAVFLAPADVVAVV